MAQLDQVDFELFLEANGVRVSQKLYEHGVTTITELAKLSRQTLEEWDLVEKSNNLIKFDNGYTWALSNAQRLLRDSSHDLAAIRQELLVRARMHYMYVCTIAE